MHHLCLDYSLYGVAMIRGSLKVHVSFAKKPYKRDDILQKTQVILRSLLIVAAPYAYYVSTVVYICLYVHLHLLLESALCVSLYTSIYLYMTSIGQMSYIDRCIRHL